MLHSEAPNVDIPRGIKDFKPKYTKIFINNEWVDAVSKKTYDDINPYNGNVTAKIAEGDREDVDKAVEAATEAFRLGSVWRTMDASKRGLLLHKLADLMERDHVILASLESLDNGKPYTDSYTMDITMAIACLRYYAGWADKIHGKVIPVDGDYFTYTRREPIGVCGAILPWTYPACIGCMKIGPALATGNTLVIKPAKQTPLTALHIASLAKEAGFPPGVMNVVTGSGGKVGNAIASHMGIGKVTFTGSTDIGKIVMAATAQSNVKRVTLELGGKSPNIVFADADLELAARIVHHGLFLNQGQTCCNGTRVFVEGKIYDQFIAKSKALAQKRVLGDPFDPTTDQGPQIDEAQVKIISGYVESGIKEGATLVCGGKKHDDEGRFYEPTIFADVKDEMKIAKEEIFGPVMAVFRFDSMKDLVDIANNTIYGLAAGVITKDIDKALYVANNIQAGTVWVNCYDVLQVAAPFGGYKQSGFGRDYGEEALEEYTVVKTVTIKVPQKNT